MRTYDVDEINRIPIISVALRIGLKVDRNNKTLCFLHNENTPSLSFNIKSNYWKCFGCNAGGSVIELIKASHKLEFQKACEWLSSEFDILVRDDTGKQRKPTKIALKKLEVTPSYIDSHIKPDSEVYDWLINHIELTPKTHEYLTRRRKLSDEIISRFNIRDIENPKDLYSELTEKWGKERLINCGLVKITEQDDHRFIWWDHVIVIPYYDEKNTLTYLQGRRFSGEKPKYINLKGIRTEIFNASILNGLEPNSNLCICEGAMDAIAATQYGVNSIGIIGASGFKKEWVLRLKDFLIFVAPDNDDAGKNFAKNIAIHFEEFGKAVQIIKIPKTFKDVSEYFESKS